MTDIAIKAENIGKLYRLGQIGTGTISHDLNRWLAKLRGKEDPFAKIGETNDRAQKGETDYVWALKDVNFEIKKGEAVGIIGRNGAGKSTLLKLLSKVTKPTTGSIKVNGRIASLLEVGTGFHPEMTGRENIYLNGAILGMTKKEITRKFDEIVDFSGVQRYIDTPVKRYSSGMYVRLAFAVAAHLESEILIVDEVLAVGDAEFQKKCLGKMGEVSKGEGRTVLFVSHNMSAVQDLCIRSVLLNNGTVKDYGNTSAIIEKYLNIGRGSCFWEGDMVNDELRVTRTYIKSLNEDYGDALFLDSELEIGIELFVLTDIKNMVCGFNIFSSFGYPILRSNFNDFSDSQGLCKGQYLLRFKIPAYFLAVGMYEVKFDIAIPYVKKFFDRTIDISFQMNPRGPIGNKFNMENDIYYNSLVRTDLFDVDSLNPIS